MKTLKMKRRGILLSSCKVEKAEETPLCICVCQHVRVTHCMQAGGKRDCPERVKSILLALLFGGDLSS